MSCFLVLQQLLAAEGFQRPILHTCAFSLRPFRGMEAMMNRWFSSLSLCLLLLLLPPLIANIWKLMF